MPEFHSLGGKWHGGKKENCRKCTPLVAVPVAVKEEEVKKPANGRRKNKETVNADVQQ